MRNGAYAATDKALQLKQKGEANCNASLWDQMEGLANLLRCPCCGIQLKRVTWRINLTEDDVTVAYKRYRLTCAYQRKSKRR